MAGLCEKDLPLPLYSKERLPQPFFQDCRKLRHRPALRTNVSGNFNSQFVRFGNRLAIQNGSTESSGKGVTRPYRISYRNFRSFLERDNSRSKYIAAIDTTSQNQHFQIVFCQQNPVSRYRDNRTYG